MELDYLIRLTGNLLIGAKTTVLTFIIVIIASMPLGFIFTLLAKCSFRTVRWLANFYIYITRGTPLLLQLLFIYFALPIIPLIGKYLTFDRFTAACIGFILNYAAYFAEIFRGGLMAVDKGQYEAADVLGLNGFQTMVHIVIPQMFRVSLPAVGNESITLVKDTALLYAIGVPEMLHIAKTAVNRDVSIVPFFIAGLIYLLMVLVLTAFFKLLEKRFGSKAEAGG